jgi:CheY-like chemotaxis protein
MNDVIRKTEKLLEGLLPATVRLVIKPGEGPMNVMADRAQLERVFMNITANARDAMPDGGTITIMTGRAELGADYIKARRYGTVGVYATVSITDTGIGMDEAVRKRIFEPFFTTKSYGKGTGFGLSIVYGIVKQHNGYIDVESEPGRGTTFTVYVPVERPAPAETERMPAAVLEGSETILVAEDEEPVRKLMKTVLEGFGYRVLTAADGEEAVRLFTENRGRIQLLILDVIMPRMNGREAYRAIEEMQPGIKALFMSGYAEDIISRKGIIEPGLNFVLKPVPPRELVRKAREVLDA